MKVTKPTFKNHERTGRYRSFQSDSADIKLKGKEVGYLIAKNITSDIEVWFCVTPPDPRTPNCPFRKVKLRYVGPDMKTTKQFIKDNWESITAGFAEKGWTLFPLD